MNKTNVFLEQSINEAKVLMAERYVEDLAKHLWDTIYAPPFWEFALHPDREKVRGIARIALHEMCSIK